MEIFIIEKGNLNSKSTLKKRYKNYKCNEVKINDDIKFYQSYKETNILGNLDEKFYQIKDEFYYEYGWSSEFGKEYSEDIKSKLDIFNKEYYEIDGQYIHIKYVDNKLYLSSSLTQLSIVWYYREGNNLLITNSFESLVEILLENKIKLTKNKDYFLNFCTTSPLRYYDSIYNEIKRYRPSTYVEFSKDNINVYSKPTNNNFENKEINDEFWNYITKRYVESINKRINSLNFQKINLDLTGGRDSRFSLGIILSLVSKDKIKINTFGNSLMSDVLLSKYIVDELELEDNFTLSKFNVEAQSIKTINYIENIKQGKVNSFIRELYLNPILEKKDAKWNDELKITGYLGNVINSPFNDKFHKKKYDSTFFNYDKTKSFELKVEKINNKDNLNALDNNLHNHSASIEQNFMQHTFSILAMDLLNDIREVLTAEELVDNKIYKEILSRTNKDILINYPYEEPKSYEEYEMSYGISNQDSLLNLRFKNPKTYFFEKNKKYILNTIFPYIKNDDYINNGKLSKFMKVNFDNATNEYRDFLKFIAYSTFIYDINFNNLKYDELINDKKNSEIDVMNYLVKLRVKKEKYLRGLATIYEEGDKVKFIVSTNKNFKVLLKEKKDNSSKKYKEKFIDLNNTYVIFEDLKVGQYEIQILVDQIVEYKENFKIINKIN